MGVATPASRGPLVAAGLGLIAGSALQLQQPELWGAQVYAGLGLGALVLLAIQAWPLRKLPRLGLGALALGCIVLAFAATGLRAGVRLAEALPAELEGRDLVVVGLVTGLPQRAPEAWRFRFEVETAALDGAAVTLPRQLSIGWYAGAADLALPALRAGQRWQLTLRLKRPHGVRNPHGFDYELHLFEQGVRATGYVRTTRDSTNRMLAERAARPVDRARQSVRDAIETRVSDASAAGLLAALAVGDQAAIEREDWALYRDTGVAHLMSISGLHVTMFAWLAGLAVNRLWRFSTRAVHACPAPTAARWGGLLAACAYAVFAGWGVPAQRTALMLVTTTLLGAAGLRWGWPLVWGSAAVVVTMIDPWALLQPGFWLSFVAVGLLMGSSEAHPALRAASGLAPAGGGPPDSTVTVAPQAPASRATVLATSAKRLAASGLRTQVVATLGLAPLTLVFFQQISLVGFVANLVAIPVVTLLVTPLALLGVLWAPLWSVGASVAGALNTMLQLLAAPSWAVWTVPAAAAWAVPCALLGAALVLLPLPWHVRALGLPLVIPLLAPVTPRPAEGAFELTAIDVGQGTAVLLRTANHTLLYDAGPQYSREADAGERVLVPLLRALGERRLDTLMLSHRDTDHVGGAAALLRTLPVGRLSSSLEPSHPLLAMAGARGSEVQPCQAGQRWAWDGVTFEVLHPGADLLARAGLEKTKSNALSCVLLVSGRWAGRAQRALLTGDIEREQELALVTALGRAISAEVLVVPHHGSKTSSSAAFLDAVGPRVAVVQTGYRNRFGHPAPEVVARYTERGISMIDSPGCGAWRFGPAGERCWRTVAQRYWHHRPAATRDNGLEVAKTTVVCAPSDAPESDSSP